MSKLYFEFYTYLPNKSNEKFQNLQITLKIKSNLDTTQNFVENIIFRKGGLKKCSQNCTLIQRFVRYAI